LPPSKSIQPKEAYHHGDLREQLIQAARQLIAENGADHFKVADACKLAGVSIAAPYRHFANRDDWLDHVVIEAMARMRDQMIAALSDVTPGSVASITQIGCAYVEFARAEPHVFRLMFRPCEDEERHARLEGYGRETYSVLLNEVARVLGKKEFDEQVLKLALPMWTFTHGTAVLLIDDMLNVTDVELDVESMIGSVCEQLCAGSVPAKRSK